MPGEEGLKAMLAAAYVAGAKSVHDEYMREGELPCTDYPEFEEAGDDYAAWAVEQS
jgi:hypothetical protein